MVAIQPQPALLHEYQEPLSEARFWGLIALLDWSDPSDEEAVAVPLTAALAALSPASIQQFQDLLAEKLWRLDTEAHARASLGNDASKHLSVDYFLYDRCYVVARGQALYEKVLRNPAEFPVGRSFEELLYVAGAAYQKQTGGEAFTHVPAYDYETYSNENGWPEACPPCHTTTRTTTTSPTISTKSGMKRRPRPSNMGSVPSPSAKMAFPVECANN